MDESAAAPTAPPRQLRARYPWLVGGALLLSVFAALMIAVLTHSPLVSFDVWFRQAVQQQAGSRTWGWLRHGPTSPARIIVDSGAFRNATPFLGAVTLIAIIIRRSLRPLLTSAAGVALILAAVLPFKTIIRRPAPRQFALTPHMLGAFPSGHTTVSSVVYVLAVLVLMPSPRGRGRRIALWVTSVWGFLVGCAMIWCDLHWFSDVAAAWAMAPVVIWLATRLNGGRPRSAQASGTATAAQPEGEPSGQPAG